ncbi:MAG TPA: helix-turn-helix transcriptional regulator [Thermoanaerobaculia bacterium]|nr:helix-turn-helix transcriptional regulator [Thermoanaerobaculia bacterium]
MFGKRVRELREKRGLTHEKFAQIADLTTSFVSTIERGRKVPSLTTVLKIARALKMDAAELLADFSYDVLRRLRCEPVGVDSVPCVDAQARKTKYKRRAAWSISRPATGRESGAAVSKAARALGRLGGLKGCKARAAKLVTNGARRLPAQRPGSGGRKAATIRDDPTVVTHPRRV